MKNLIEIIQEKLILNKDISTKNKDISNFDIPWKFQAFFNATSAKDKQQIYELVEKAYRNNRKPSSLYNSNSSMYTIVNKWFVAFLLRWDNAIMDLQKCCEESITNIENIDKLFYNIISLLEYEITHKIIHNDNSQLIFLRKYINMYMGEDDYILDCCKNYFKIYNTNKI